MPQSLRINKLLNSDNWGLARVIRRDAPWNPVAPRFPVNTHFESVRDGTGVDIYMVDTGVKTTHPEFNNNVTNVYEYYSSGGAGDDTSTGHGTGVASILVGKTCGIARGAQIRSFKVYASNSTGSGVSFQAGLDAVLSDWNSRSAINRPGVCMVNFAMSYDFSTVTANILAAGLPIIATTHNFANAVELQPASYANVIGVGGIGAGDLPYYLGIAADASGSPQYGTPYGSWVDILAPAQAIRMANKNTDGFMNWNGNSFSTPHVAAIAACMLQGHNRMTTLAEVQAFNAKLLANATTGKLRAGFGLAPLPDRIAYLDPLQAAPESFSL